MIEKELLFFLRPSVENKMGKAGDDIVPSRSEVDGPSSSVPPNISEQSKKMRGTISPQ